MSKFIAIDLDPQGIFAIGGSARGTHSNLDSAVAWDGTEGEPPPALTVETAKQIGEQLRERLNSARVSQAPVLFSIPRDRVILKELKYPPVPLLEEPNVVKFQAMKELTDSPDEVILDYVPLSTGTSEGERRSMAVAVRKEFFNAIQALCAAANLKLAAVTPRPYCLAAGLNRAFATGAAPRPEVASDPIAMLTLSPGGGEFTVIRQGTVSGSSDVTFTRTISAPTLSSETELLASVRRNLTMYAGANPGHPIQALYIAEPEGRLVNRLRGALSIPVHAYDPIAGVTSTVPESNHGRFAAAVGLLAANGLGELPINFATPRQPKQERDPKQKQILIGGLVTLLIVVLGLGYGLLVVDDAENELIRLRQKKADLELEVSQLEPDYNRLQAAVKWESRRVVWLDMLYDVSDQFQRPDGKLEHSDSMVVRSYMGKAIPPDSKTGKQESQATIEINLTAKSYEPVQALMAAMESDNRDPKTKYYIINDKSIKPGASDTTTRDYTLAVRLNNRPASQFVRSATFERPPRWGYPPVVVPPKEHKESDSSKEKEKDKDKEKDKELDLVDNQ